MMQVRRQFHGGLRGRTRTGGFTLIELMVAVSLLVIVILAVGRIFRDAGKAVSLSQVSMNMFSNVRAVNQQIESDVHEIDRNGFIVIRSQIDPGDNNPILANKRRFDQICFIANGTFVNRTGTTSTTNPLADSTVANSALVWLGHGMVDVTTAHDQSIRVPLNQVAVPPIFSSSDPTDNEPGYVLCRHAMLLMGWSGGVANQITLTAPSGGTYTVAAYPYAGLLTNTGLATQPIPAQAGEPGNADISDSRIAVAYRTPAEIMQDVVARKSAYAPTNRYEADNYCYRCKVLPNAYASPISLINGAIRMHPTLLQACPSFAVQWTDGTLDGNGNLAWFGINDANVTITKYGIGADSTEPAPGASGDNYTAVFSFDNKSKWLTALKFTYRVTDLNDRLNGGRTFTEVVRVPQQ